MKLPDKWQRAPILFLIRTAAHAGRIARKAKAIDEGKQVRSEFFDQWYDQWQGYGMIRFLAIWVRSSEVVRLAQAIGLPEVTVEHVHGDPFEIAIRLDNLIRSLGSSVDDPEEGPLDD